MTKVIGLTGGFGTGKTFVASLLRSSGAVVLDADRIAHDCIAKGKPAYRKIVAAFGPDVLGAGRRIDRTKLAAVVFGDTGRVRRLNRIVHPDVIAVIRRSLKKAGEDDIVVIDAPLLVEAGLARTVDSLIVVTCPRNAQIARCMKKFCLGRQDVLKRIGNQIPMAKKVAMADFVIDNGKTKDGTRRQVKRIWKEIAWR